MRYTVNERLKMKHKYLVVVLVMNPLFLGAMMPDVTNWKILCCDQEKKEKLVSVYKNFCYERVKSNVPWAAGSAVPFLLKAVRSNRYAAAVIGLFALRQNYLLGRNLHRNEMARDNNLFYLNHDVVEQLGYPSPVGGTLAYCNYRYTGSNVYEWYVLGYREKQRTGQRDTFDLTDVYGIEEALSGKHTASWIGYRGQV